MYYRFQKTTGGETSMHVYPARDTLRLYKNQEAVSAMIERLESGEVAFDDVAIVDDIENYFFNDGYVCCHSFYDELDEEIDFSGSGVAAYDDYVVVFESNDAIYIHDGVAAKMDNIVAVYQKKCRNTYTCISKKNL